MTVLTKIDVTCYHKSCSEHVATECQHNCVYKETIKTEVPHSPVVHVLHVQDLE